MNFSKLITCIDLIVCELSKSGRKETAAFFISKLNVLKNTNSSMEEKMGVAEELSKCGAMGQYGNFSLTEESILSNLTEAAQEELKSSI